MIITKAKYYKDYRMKSNIEINAYRWNKMFVPLDPANRHYQAILEWVAEGNTIAEAD